MAVLQVANAQHIVSKGFLNGVDMALSAQYAVVRQAE
jgi:hypothetical protein